MVGQANKAGEGRGAYGQESGGRKEIGRRGKIAASISDCEAKNGARDGEEEGENDRARK